VDAFSSRESFLKVAAEEATRFAAVVWQRIVEGDQLDVCDSWMRREGSMLLRRLLGEALSARAQASGVAGTCLQCSRDYVLRQHRPFVLHTVLPGREVEVRVVYGQCPQCHAGVLPLLTEMKVDPEGFTPELRDLALLAGTLEPYADAAEQLLERFAGVNISHEKIQRLVAGEGPLAAEFCARQESSPPQSGGVAYVGIDGGMIHVDRAWQEVKMFTSFRAEDAIQSSPTRGALAVREVAAVRGPPEKLSAVLEQRAETLTAGARTTVVLGDGAPWIWNLAAHHFPNRVEILDWYHAKEHVSATARILYGEGEKADRWREVQLTRLWDDGVDDVLSSLRFLLPHQRAKAKRETLSNLEGYLSKNKQRVTYKTFRQSGFRIGSGFVESAVNHVIQQRMKRTGMHWHASGADSMLALRSLYRSGPAWDSFRRSRRKAA
jgi:hypothetical protein